MTDSTLDPQSDKAWKQQRAAERLQEWVNAKVALLWDAQAADAEGANETLDRALDGEWDDAPLDEDDYRWNAVKKAWRKADLWEIETAIKILEAL